MTILFVFDLFSQEGMTKILNYVLLYTHCVFQAIKISADSYLLALCVSV